MNINRVFSFLLVFTILVNLTTLSSNAMEIKEKLFDKVLDVQRSNERYEDFEYDIISSYDTIIIKKYIGYDANVKIPEEIDGKKVTVIGDFAFDSYKNLKSISIPNSVVYIREYAFRECTGLTNIDISNNVTSIGDFAFSGCTELTSINIPDSVVSIGFGAFSGCTGLTSIDIPNSVTSINYSAFLNCRGLTNVSLSDSITYIDGWTFKNCSGLTNIKIPDSVTSIKKEAFAYCTKLTSVAIPDSVTLIEYNAFDRNDNNFDKLTIYCNTGSQAEKFAKAKNILTKPLSEFEDITIQTDLPKIGDLDNDGRITSADSLLILRQSVSLENFTDEQFILADIDGDNKITSADALEVLRNSVGFKSYNIGDTIKK